MYGSVPAPPPKESQPHLLTDPLLLLPLHPPQVGDTPQEPAGYPQPPTSICPSAPKPLCYPSPAPKDPEPPKSESFSHGTLIRLQVSPLLCLYPFWEVVNGQGGCGCGWGIARVHVPFSMED